MTQRFFVTLLAFFLLAALACSGSSEAEPGATASPTSEGMPPAAGSPTPSQEPEPTGPLPRLRLERVFPNLSFATMTGLYQGQDGRFYVLERPGRILTFENSPSAQPQVFLDIRDKVDDSGSEMGLLGFALAPDFAQTGYFYLNYNAGSPRRTIIARYTAPGPRTQADPASEQILLDVGQPFPNHKGGQTSFGPDGFLYIGFGDGGSGNDPQGNGQNRNVLLGKILRIDVSGGGSGLPYRIPADNPFVGQGGVRQEIWAYGFRNPWRFSFDRQTGELWAGDVGQNTREEIDLVTKGGNYGWVIMEGNGCVGSGSCDRTGLTLPVHEYRTASPNCSVTGGFVYRGSTVAALRGAYVFGDFCSGIIWGLRYDGGSVNEVAELVRSGLQISSFAQDNQGEIYALAYGSSGGIYRIVSE